MTVLHGYIALAEFRLAVGDATYAHGAVSERAIAAASRQIDLWCGRHFWQETAPTPRLFRASDRTMVCTGDFDSTTGVVVETDDNADGVFETLWTSLQWQAEPLVRFNQQPFEMVTTTTRTREFPLDSRRPRVRVTAQWGWAQVPQPVEQACLALASLYFRSKDMAGVAIGVDLNIETISADPIKVAMKLVEPYAVEGGTLYMSQAG